MKESRDLVYYTRVINHNKGDTDLDILQILKQNYISFRIYKAMKGSPRLQAVTLGSQKQNKSRFVIYRMQGNSLMR